MLVTVYKRPHGQTEVIDLLNIHDEDAKWFEENNVSVSIESTGTDIIVYGDVGLVNEDGEPEEIIIFSGTDDCYTTMTRLRVQCKKVMSR